MTRPATALVAVLLLTAAATAASAQTRVRVTRDRATIWRAGFTVAAAVVPRGTELEAVARLGTWYEVRLPSARDLTGFIAVAQVERTAGPEPPERPLVTPGARGGARRAGARAALPPERAFGVRGFGDFGFQWYRAHDTFTAVFGKPGGFQYGGGGEVRFDRLFVQASIERFTHTGQRVFESGGQVFGLGIEDAVTITPVQVTVGYRVRRRAANPYIGGGAGRIRLREASPFAADGENLDQSFTSYHVLAGVQWRSGSSWWGTAFEVQYTHVPDALRGGVAELFGEHNLGGIEARVKLEIGR